MKKYLLSALFLIAFAASASAKPVTKKEVMEAQKNWADGIVTIGELYQHDGDYKHAARNLINDLYDFEDGEVLFKPAKASNYKFLYNKDQALSYFVGGQKPEDRGFAIHPWSEVTFDEKEMGVFLDDNLAVSMGNFYFTDAKTEDVIKVEYTFGFKRSPKDGKLKIFMHHSSIPYNAQNF